MNIGRFAGVALALASFALTGAAEAQTTIFSTFGPGNSFNLGGGEGEAGPFSIVGQTISAGPVFSPTVTGILSTITVAYYHQAGTNDAHLYLTDSFGSLGNTAASLESFFFTPPAGSGTILVLPSIQHPVLTAGKTYYLYGLESANELNGWNQSFPSVSGPNVSKIGSAPGPYTLFPTGVSPAFSVQANTTLVPESSGLANMTGALLALGLSGLVMAGKKKKAKALLSTQAILRERKTE